MRLISGENLQVSGYEIAFLHIALKVFGYIGYTSALVYFCGSKAFNEIF